MAPTATWSHRRLIRRRSRALSRFTTQGLVWLAILAGVAVAGCSSSPAKSALKVPTSSTADPTAAVDTAVLAAWRAAETAFYLAEANPQGLFSPQLGLTMVNPELQLVKTNLAGQEAENFIGRGPWNLGDPRVVSLGSSEDDPTTATVVSCIDDTELLVNENTDQPAAGPGGTPEWDGETSTMILSQGTWKLSQQSAVGNTNRAIACAGIS